MKSPSLLAIKDLIASGRIGEITHFNGIYLEDFMCDPNVPHSWRLTKKGGGKGALGDMGSHLISMAIWLCGPFKEVVSRLQTIHTERPDSSTGEMRQVETDDQFSALGTFESGALFTMHTSWLGQGHKMNLGFEITGTKGAIKFDQERMGEFQLFEMDGNSEISTNGYKTVLIGPYHPFFGNFCPAPGHHVGFNEMKMIDKLYFNPTARLITQRPEFFIALTTMVIGTQFFVAGFLGEIILQSRSNTERYHISEETKA